MARVVQRRSGPPYLLIVFIFLCLVSSTLAVLRHMDAEENYKRADEAERVTNRLASLQEREGKLIQEMIEHSAKGTDRLTKQTVVAQLSQRIGDLAELITGVSTSYEVAMQKAEEVRKTIGDDVRPGLADEVLDQHKQLEVKEDEIEALEAQKDEKDKLIRQAKEQADKLVAQLTSQINDLKTKTEGLDAKLNSEHEGHLKQLAESRDDKKRKVGELNQVIAQKNDQTQRLQSNVRTLQVQVAKLKARIRELEGIDPDKPGPELRTKPDGAILSVNNVEDICYIDIGRKDGVQPGFFFSIYPPGAITRGAQSKGRLVVTNVQDNISLCRIQKRDKGNPIAKEDVVANLAYDRGRTYSFVVEGEFDLYGKGRPSPSGAAEVRALVTRHGGSLVDEVDVRTDFVIMGTKPDRPPRLPEDAPVQVRQTYQEQLKKYQRYSDVKQKALDLRIPVLNTNRFLDLIGFTPARRLEQR